MVTIRDSSRREGLSVKQRKAVALIASGRSVTDTAKQLGLARQTVSEWRRIPAYQAALDRLTEETVACAREELRGLAGAATSALRDILSSAQSDNTRLQAVRLVLDGLGVLRVGPSAGAKTLTFGADFDLNRTIATYAAEGGGVSQA